MDRYWKEILIWVLLLALLWAWVYYKVNEISNENYSRAVDSLRNVKTYYEWRNAFLREYESINSLLSECPSKYREFWFDKEFCNPNNPDYMLLSNTFTLVFVPLYNCLYYLHFSFWNFPEFDDILLECSNQKNKKVCADVMLPDITLSSCENAINKYKNYMAKNCHLSESDCKENDEATEYVLSGFRYLQDFNSGNIFIIR